MIIYKTASYPNAKDTKKSYQSPLDFLQLLIKIYVFYLIFLSFLIKNCKKSRDPWYDFLASFALGYEAGL